MAYPLGHQAMPDLSVLISRELAELGPMSRQEKRVATVFALVAISWVGRGLFEITAFVMLLLPLIR